MYAKKYIYDGDNWPGLSFDESAVRDALSQVYHVHGRLFGRLDSLGFAVKNGLLLSALSNEIVDSSAIEGERIDLRSVQSSVARRLGLDTGGLDEVFPDHYTEGVIEMALEASQNYDMPVTKERLCNWHGALFPTGRSGNYRITVAAYRTEGMQIVSGALGNEKVHYTAPEANRVPNEMKSFIKWVETEQRLDPFVKASIAHLRFEAIHPFDDGNGRIGRAIADLLLARAEKSAKRYYSLSSQLLKERNDYYKQLEWAQKLSGEIDQWVEWFLCCLVRAMETSEESIGKAIQKSRLFDMWRKTPMNDRQQKMMNKLFEGFKGKLTTDKWAKICKCSHDTALRDIDDLITKGILLRSPEGGRSTSYDIVGMGKEPE